MAQQNHSQERNNQSKNEEAETQEVLTKIKVKVNAQMAVRDQVLYDPDQSNPKAKNIGKEAVTVEETANVQEWLLKKQLVRA